MRILIVDDFAIVREGLKKILCDEPGIEIVAETGVGGEVVRLVDKYKVELVILDISMPGMSGMDVLTDLKRHFSKVAVLMLSIHLENKYAVRALKLGASGYIRKDTAIEELVVAIRRIEAGGKYITPVLAEHMAEFLEAGDMSASRHYLLSNREFEVMCLLASGLTLAQLAKKLNISISTATTYKNRVFKKMNFLSNADVIRYCMQHYLVD